MPKTLNKKSILEKRVARRSESEWQGRRLAAPSFRVISKRDLFMTKLLFAALLLAYCGFSFAGDSQRLTSGTVVTGATSEAND